MVRWRSTDYTTFEPESPRATLVADGRNQIATRYDIAWDGDSISRAAEDFLGFPEIKTGKVGARVVTYISRVTPHAYPYRFITDPLKTGTPVFHCTGLAPVAQGKAAQDASQGDTFDRGAIASCVATYDTLTYDVFSDTVVANLQDDVPDPFPHDAQDPIFRYITRQWKPAGKVLVLGTGFYRVLAVVPDARLPIKHGIGLNVPAAELLYTWHQVPESAIPFGTIEVTMGAINSVAFDGFTAQTLLLLSVDLRRYWHPVGIRVVDITYRMKWLPNINPADGLPTGHNFVPRVIAGKVVMKEVTSNGDNNGDRPYRTKPFKPLFRPPQ